MDLRDYEQAKFAIAESLRTASRIIPENHTGWRERQQDLFARLAEDRFNLVMVGRFSRGKTSLMNAILGTDRLPTGIAPLTSVITTVTYGSEEKVVLKYDNRILDKEIPIEALPQYITQRGNPGNDQRIRVAEIQLPAEFLRRGFYLVDTPGLGSVIAENTRTTEAFMPEADALLLVTSFESPLSQEEFQFLKIARSSRQRIFVVINKHDTVSVDQREDGIAFVPEQLGWLFGSPCPHIFSVSSTDGLHAKRARDATRLAASGIRDLEAQLLSFLLKEKSTEFLVGMCDRAAEFLEELPNSDAIAAAGKQVSELAKRLGQARETVLVVETNADSTFANLHRLGSCEICAYIADEVWQFICRYQYDLSVSRDEQQHFAGSGGFCPFHTWEYESIASPYGTCNAFPALLDRLATGLRRAASKDTPEASFLNAVQKLLPSRKNCTLCNVRDRAEQRAIEATAQRLASDARRTMDTLSVICISHLCMLLAELPNNTVKRELAERQATILERFSEDMRRYALKHDAVRRHLANQEETAVAERALQSVGGRRNVNFCARAGG
jgi:small GTP-binding protein